MALCDVTLVDAAVSLFIMIVVRGETSARGPNFTTQPKPTREGNLYLNHYKRFIFANLLAVIFLWEFTAHCNQLSLSRQPSFKCYVESWKFIYSYKESLNWLVLNRISSWNPEVERRIQKKPNNILQIIVINSNLKSQLLVFKAESVISVSLFYSENYYEYEGWSFKLSDLEHRYNGLWLIEFY